MSNEYNQSTAYIPLYYSYSSYCDPSNIQQWNCKWCNSASNDFEPHTVISIDYLQAFIGYENDNDRIVISFRGTHNYQDWFKDMEYKQIAYSNVPNGYVHEGFYNAYSEIRKSGLITSLQTLLTSHPNTTDILITGHSMGGALTELCALDIIDNEIINEDTNVEIYTFGCPRWGNKVMAQYLNDLTNIITNWRIVNHNDPVAIVPGKFLGSYGFHHTSQEILYNDYSKLEYTVCDGSGEDPECGYSLWHEDSNVHLWYLNVYESCSDDDILDEYGNIKPESSFGAGPVNDEQSNEPESNGEQYGNNLNVNSHWMLSLMLICIGFVVAIIYYFIVKKCQKMYGYYQSIPEQYPDNKSLTQNIQKNKGNTMKHSLLNEKR